MTDRDPLIVEWHRNLPVSVPGVGALVATWDEIADLVEQARADEQANAAEESGEASVLHFRDGYDAGYRDGRASMM